MKKKLCKHKVIDLKVTGFLKSHGILGMAFDSRRVRLVVHRDINDEGIQKTITVFALLVETFKVDNNKKTTAK